MADQEKQFELPPNIERYIASLSKHYGKEKQDLLQKILVNSEIRIHEEWSCDSYWNEITYGHALYLYMPDSIYLDTINNQDRIRARIKEDLNNIKNIQNEIIDEVFFEMDMPDDHDWRKESGVFERKNPIIPETAVDRIWTKGFFRVFLSHKSEVKKETSILKDKLKCYGVSCFVAHEDINPTKEWQDEIENALHSMDAFVALMTDKFHDSLWTDQEVGFAFGRGVQIISVKLGTDPYGFIGKFQALSATWESAPLELMKILIKNELMVDIYIKTMENCESYDQGNTLSTLLPFIEKLSNDQVEKMINAFNRNSQLHDSFGFKGNKPSYYGQGLVYHLKRITNDDFTFTRSGLQREKT